MVQRLLGVSVGALITFAVLVIWDVTDFTDPLPAYAIAAIIGAIASFFWPIVAGFYLARRAKERREDQIQKEVERQVGEQTHQG
jgi:hypothetical protein